MRNRRGVSLLYSVMGAALIAHFAAAAAWFFQRDVQRQSTTRTAIRRADQLASAAANEAFAAIARAVIEPEADLAHFQTSWFQRLRTRVPGTDQVDVDCPQASALAAAEGFTLASCLVRVAHTSSTGTVHGSLECVVEVLGDQVARRLRERRLYLNIRNDSSAREEVLSTRCVLLDTVGRNHASF
jgi:hypothetical protein